MVVADGPLEDGTGTTTTGGLLVPGCPVAVSGSPLGVFGCSVDASGCSVVLSGGATDDSVCTKDAIEDSMCGVAVVGSGVEVGELAGSGVEEDGKESAELVTTFVDVAVSALTTTLGIGCPSPLPPQSGYCGMRV